MLGSVVDCVTMAAVVEEEMMEELSYYWWTGHPGSVLPVRMWSECHEGEVVVVVVVAGMGVEPLPQSHCYSASHHQGDSAPAYIFSDESSYCT